jgi:hypothetical protein
LGIIDAFLNFSNIFIMKKISTLHDLKLSTEKAKLTRGGKKHKAELDKITDSIKSIDSITNAKSVELFSSILSFFAK